MLTERTERMVRATLEAIRGYVTDINDKSDIEKVLDHLYCIKHYTDSAVILYELETNCVNRKVFGK
jgi:hypothetical protein